MHGHHSNFFLAEEGSDTFNEESYDSDEGNIRMPKI